MATLVVTQLPLQITEEELQKLFSAFSGQVRNLDKSNIYNVSAKVEVPDNKYAEAVNSLNKKKIGGSQIKVACPNPPRAGVAKIDKPSQNIKVDQQVVSPYRFVRRPEEKSKKQVPVAYHDRLLPDHYDIAFEVTWKSVTPLAANPCNAEGVSPTWPLNDDHKYQGYDKRWLMMGNRLAISPFTVKSAIANGFAALMGSCYRVPDRSEKHPDKPDGKKFNYNGAYKRYRVNMNNSRPGILESINRETGEVVIRKMTEYYYDDRNKPDGVTFIKDKEYYCKYDVIRFKNIITRNNLHDSRQPQATKAVRYFGEYTFGMDLTFGPGEFNKGHYHRFYDPVLHNGKPATISGTINVLNLKTRDEQKGKVYMGVFEKLEKTARYDKRTGLDGNPWHQDPEKFKPGAWVYYQEFGGKVVAIGLNFQFKTTFDHSDAVPPSQRACNNMMELCPRCALFGMSDEAKRKDHKAVGYRGRFKAGSLINDEELTFDFVQGTVPMEEGAYENVNFEVLKNSDGEIVARQFLLPIMGAPKPSKRDVKGGYYENGFIRGAKEYLHSGYDWDNFSLFIDKEVNSWRTLKDVYKNGCPRVLEGTEYNHSLRNYAVVCRDKLKFKGTVGAENCTVAEIAALVLLLEQSDSKQGFKIGLGKSIGLGSVSSRITRVWIRTSNDYHWESIDITEAAREQLNARIAGLKSEMEALAPDLESRRDRISQIGKRMLKYPAPDKYWNNF